jgi:hypothetical protein
MLGDCFDMHDYAMRMARVSDIVLETAVGRAKFDEMISAHAAAAKEDADRDLQQRADGLQNEDDRILDNMNNVLFPQADELYKRVRYLRYELYNQAGADAPSWQSEGEGYASQHPMKHGSPDEDLRQLRDQVQKLDAHVTRGPQRGWLADNTDYFTEGFRLEAQLTAFCENLVDAWQSFFDKGQGARVRQAVDEANAGAASDFNRALQEERGRFDKWFGGRVRQLSQICNTSLTTGQMASARAFRKAHPARGIRLGEEPTWIYPAGMVWLASEDNAYGKEIDGAAEGVWGEPKGEVRHLATPVNFALGGNRNLVLGSEDAEGARVTCAALRSCALMSVLSVPAGQMALRVCDTYESMGAGDDLARFVRAFPKVTGGRVVSDRQDVDRLLRGIAKSMDDVLQNKLPGTSGGVAGFNRQNPHNRIPYRTLLIQHFPHGFDQGMRDTLFWIVRNAPGCGVQVLLHYDGTVDPSVRNADECHQRETELQQALVDEPIFRYLRNDGFWRAVAHRYLSFSPVRVDFTGWGYDLIADFAARYEREQNRVLGAKDVWNESGFQRGSSVAGLSIPFGMDENGRIRSLELGDGVAGGSSHYALVVGPTGSGKSVMLHQVIASALFKYPPEELELYLLDFKEGTEFDVYTRYRLPQLRCVSLDSAQQFGESVLQLMERILGQRAELFKRASANGSQITNIEQYRKTGRTMPRILVVMDEFQTLFSRDSDKRCADKASVAFSDLISRARVYGIHFLMATQTLQRVYDGNFSVSKATLGEVHVRVALRNTSSKECGHVFGDHGDEAFGKLTSKAGSAVYTEDFSAPGARVVGMRVSYMNDAERDKALSRVATAYQGRRFEPTRVFRSKEVPQIELPVLRERSSDNGKIYLGQPVALGKMVGVPMTSKVRANLLIAGDDARMVARVTRNWVVQAARERDGKPSVWVLDGAACVGSAPLLGSGMTRNMPAGSVREVGNLFQVVPAIRELYEEYQARRSRMAHDISLPEDAVPLHMVISSYSRLDPVVRLMRGQPVDEYVLDEERGVGEVTEAEAEKDVADEVEDVDQMDALLNQLAAQLQGDGRAGASPKTTKAPGSTKVAPTKAFRTLLESGQLCDIHVVLASDDFASLRDLMPADRSLFQHRIVPRTMNPDVCHYIDSDIDMKSIGANMAVYWDGSSEAILVKPFAVIPWKGV